MNRSKIEKLNKQLSFKIRQAGLMYGYDSNMIAKLSGLPVSRIKMAQRNPVSSPLPDLYKIISVLGLMDVYLYLCATGEKSDL